MRILLINPPHTAIGSRVPDEHLPPLGLLCVGGPLIDAGHTVELLDAEFGPLTPQQIVARTVAYQPDLVMFGHSGSTSVHPTITELSKQIRKVLPKAYIVYGGVFPTYHWREILNHDAAVDVIVKGEGELTALRLADALAELSPGEPIDGAVASIPGLAFRRNDQPFATPPAPVISDLDDYRIGWELIDHARYSYWGDKRAVVVQFARGCPFRCTYCGQRGFWTKWRHRDPVKLADEIARMHREHGVEVFNFADELPSGAPETVAEVPRSPDRPQHRCDLGRLNPNWGYCARCRVLASL